MRAEVKPELYEDLLRVEHNDGLFTFFQLHAIGSYVVYCVPKTSDHTYTPSMVPVTITITNENPPVLLVNGEVVNIQEYKIKSGIVVKRVE